MMDLVNTPSTHQRRVSGDVLDAYNAVIHSMDTPASTRGPFDLDPKQDNPFDLHLKQEHFDAKQDHFDTKGEDFDGKQENFGLHQEAEASKNVDLGTDNFGVEAHKELEVKDGHQEQESEVKHEFGEEQFGHKDDEQTHREEELREEGFGQRQEDDGFGFHQAAEAAKAVEHFHSESHAEFQEDIVENDDIANGSYVESHEDFESRVEAKKDGFESALERVEVDDVHTLSGDVKESADDGIKVDQRENDIQEDIHSGVGSEQTQQVNEFADESTHATVDASFTDDSSTVNEIHQTETDEFEFHQNANALDDESHSVETDHTGGFGHGNVKTETIHIGGMSPGDFLTKHGGAVSHGGISVEEENKISTDNTACVNESTNSIKEEDEEEIQIGKKVSDLNESDIMSRSFYGDYEARSPSPEEMIDHYANQQAADSTFGSIAEQDTPTGDGNTLEAKLAQDGAQGGNLFEISNEEASFEVKPTEQYDDLTFESARNDSVLNETGSHSVSTHNESGIEEHNESVSTHNESGIQEAEASVVALETNLDDFTSQETKIDSAFIASVQPDIPTSVPDVIPTQNEDNVTSNVDLTQDIVRQTSSVEASPKQESETSATDIATVAVAAGVAAVAAAVGVKKATSSTTKKPSVTKKLDTKPTSKPATKSVAPKPATTAKPATSAKTTATTTSTVKKSSISVATAKPSLAAKPAPKPATKAAPVATKPGVASSAPARKPLSAPATKPVATKPAAPKPAVSKPAAPKPKPAASAASKPLTNGVTKRPASATSTGEL